MKLSKGSPSITTTVLHLQVVVTIAHLSGVLTPARLVKSGVTGVGGFLMNYALYVVMCFACGLYLLFVAKARV